MEVFENPFLGTGIEGLGEQIPFPSHDAEKPAALLTHCPVFQTTPLVNNQALAHSAKVASLHIKDERGRLGLGSFKALGAAYVIACDAQRTGEQDQADCLNDRIYVTASAGNHGLSVAGGAKLFGAKSIIYLADPVPESFAQRLRDKNAVVIRHGENYEESMHGALRAAAKNKWTLLSDSSWPDYYEIPHRLMEGYLQLAKETIDQLAHLPSHIFLQAGVGGFAGAVAALVRHKCGKQPIIIVVEPDAAPALTESIIAGEPVITNGPVSSMGRLDCKEPSLIALKGLARDANFFVTLSDQEVESVLPQLSKQNLATTPSGAAGIAALLQASDLREKLHLCDQSQVLTFITEGP